MMKTMYATWLGVALTAFGWGVGTAHAGAPYLGLDLGDVVVATVKKVSDHPATNGNPPRVELEIHEVLRGDAKADRTRAVWQPTPHGCDFGDAEMYRKFVETWETGKFAGPKVGDKFVLWGKMTADKKNPVFDAYSWHAYKFTAEKRTWAVNVIRDAEEAARRYAAKLEAEKKALAKARTEWRAKTSTDDLKKYAAQADFVAIGRIVGGEANVAGGSTLQVRILKGETRKKYTGDAYFVEVRAPKDVQGLLDRETDYLVFLTLDGLKTGVSVDFYPPIKTGDGIVIADRQAVEAVKEALGRK
jgi:hypothetical protein